MSEAVRSASPPLQAWPRREALAWVAVGVSVPVGAVIAYLVATGRALVAAALLVVVPVTNFMLRYPQAAIAIWLALTPFLVATDGGVYRQLYWVLHRSLPAAALAVIIIGSMVGIARRPLPRLGWPEVAMAGYLLVTAVGIQHTSSDALATTYQLYDRVFIPMCLYLIVRLWQPGERDLRWILPAVVFLLLSQVAIGILSWTAPDVLPSPWLNRVGLRTTGSLRSPSVYGTTMLFAGLFLLHSARNRRLRPTRRLLLTLLFPVALVMAFLTYSRASWLAIIVVILGVLALYPRFGIRVTVAVAVAVVALSASGVISEQADIARTRFESEQTVLGRLPVIQASLRMFEQKPLVGWGYGSFDIISPRFQRRVGDMVVPDREHASHNLYLTLLSEQGLVGLSLYLLPPALWLIASRRAWRRIPKAGLISRRLLVSLWLVLVAHVIVNNYSNMRVVFGLGIWWLTLGMIASVVSRYQPERVATDVPGASLAPLGGTASWSQREG